MQIVVQVEENLRHCVQVFLNSLVCQGSILLRVVVLLDQPPHKVLKRHCVVHVLQALPEELIFESHLKSVNILAQTFGKFRIRAEPKRLLYKIWHLLDLD